MVSSRPRIFVDCLNMDSCLYFIRVNTCPDIFAESYEIIRTQYLIQKKPKVDSMHDIEKRLQTLNSAIRKAQEAKERVNKMLIEEQKKAEDKKDNGNYNH